MSTPSDSTVALRRGWALWPWVEIRGAGFPARLVDGLATPGVDAGEAERQACGLFVRDMAADPRFREAMLWQNKRAVTEGLDVLLRHSVEENYSKLRQKEMLVAGYLQRYCTKNDTIGFFGPIGWGRVGDGCGLQAEPHEPWLAWRQVYFEPWALQTLADAWAVDPAFAPWLHLYLAPTLWLDGDTLFGPRGIRSFNGGYRLSPEEKLVVEAALAGRRRHQVEVPDTVIDRMRNRNWVQTGINLPTDAWPERHLQLWIDGISNDDVRPRAQSALERMTSARAAVQAAAGSEAALRRALGELEATFESLTGQASHRHHGTVYGGRDLVYEDCRRHLDLTIGPDVIERLSRPLSLLLDLVRWYTWHVAQRYRTVLEHLYDALPRTRWDRDALSLTTFYLASMDHFEGDPPAIVAEVREAFTQRWLQLLGPLPETGSLRLSVADLESRAAELFAAPGPGWPGARHHCPDLMLGASGLLVLGELHAGLNAVNTWSDRLQHTHPEALEALYRTDLPQPQISPIPNQAYTRCLHDSCLAPHDLHLQTNGWAASWRSPERCLRLGDMVVRRGDNGLRVASRDGRHDFDVIQIFERFLKMQSAIFLSFALPGAHVPRVSLDDLVVVRESWTFEGDSLGFAHQPDPPARLRAARQFREQHGLPRRAFYRTEGEVKPMYVDFDASLLVENMARLVRQSSTLRLTEMLPDVSDAWLPDAAGERYTCELRWVAVDPQPWRAP